MKHFEYLLLAALVLFNVTVARKLLQATSPNKGDIEVNLLIPVRKSNTIPGEPCCQQINPSKTILISQFKRIIEDVNNAEPAILPGNLKIGYEIIDACSSENYAVSQILSWLEKRKTKARPPIAFVVGASFSRIAQRVAPILASFGIPMIDFGATSPALSDRSRFKLYARVSPSDIYLTQAISELIVHFGWECVHLLYSQGAYGENGGEAVAQHLLKKNICISGQPIALPLSATSEKAFDDAVEKMMQFPHIEPVICFCESTSISGLLDAMIASKKRNRPTNFFLVAGDFWGSQMILENQQHVAELSLTFQPKTSVGKMLSPNSKENVESWISAKILSGMDEKTDPWLNEYLESQKNQCSLNSSSNIRPCDNDALDGIEYPVSDRQLQLSNAIYAGIFGIKAFMNKLCSENSSKCNNPEDVENGPVLYQYIVNSTFAQRDGTNFSFYGNGDGYPQYYIHQFTTDQGYKAIGEWDIKRHLQLNSSVGLDFYTSSNSKSCPNRLCKTNCTPAKVITVIPGVDDGITIPCFDEEYHEEKSDDQLILTVVVAILSMLLVIAMAGHLFYIIKRRNVYGCKTRAMKYLKRIFSNPNFRFTSAERNELRELFQVAVIDCSSIQNVSEEFVGRGHEGVVSTAQLKTSKGFDIVALKSLRHESPAEVVDFIRESAMMYSFNHSNILKLTGILISPNNHFQIVVPFMPDGDLRNFLVENGHTLRDDDRLNFITQICSAMVYMSSKNCIHRDLACRNVLIELQPYMNLVKLSDFGLTRYLNESEYYRTADSSRAFPVRWWPPESLQEGRLFEERSDVWSFGIACWEIYSNGLRPYDELTNMEVYGLVVNGGHPEQPHNCKTEIYMGLMKRCWNSERLLRPRFNEILATLKEYKNSGSSTTSDCNSPTSSSTSASASLKTKINHTYVNNGNRKGKVHLPTVHSNTYMPSTNNRNYMLTGDESTDFYAIL